MGWPKGKKKPQNKVRLHADLLISNLRAAAELLGHTPTKAEMSLLCAERRAHSLTAFRARFGSWNRAIEAAGLPVRRASPQRARKIRPGLRFRVLLRDGFHCTYCGRGPQDNVRLVVDHVIPYSKGGLTIDSNLKTACHECNIGKHASLIEMEAQITL